MVAFGRMVVDDIENDFDARFVGPFTICLNSCTCWPVCPLAEYSLCGAK